MPRICLAALLCSSLFIGTAIPDDTPPPDYIKVEVRGTLENDIVAIGGESTGTLIHVGKVTWELDLGENPQLQMLAKKLHKKTVVVTGDYSQRKGVEIPIRHVVKVEMLQEAQK
jgi:hypothetical protein